MSAFKTKHFGSSGAGRRQKQAQIAQVSRATGAHLRDWPTLIRRFLFIVVSVGFLLFLIWQVVQVVAPAEIRIDTPYEDLIVSKRNFRLQGTIDPGSSLIVNSEPLLTDETGKFDKEVFLQTGLNTFVFEVKKRYSKPRIEVRHVYFEVVEEGESGE